MGNGSAKSAADRSAVYRFADVPDVAETPLIGPTTAEAETSLALNRPAVRSMKDIVKQAAAANKKGGGQGDNSKKSFNEWICHLDAKSCGSFDHGERLLAALKQQLLRPDAQKVVSKARLDTVEALAVLLYTSETTLVRDMNLFLKRRAPLDVFDPFVSPLVLGISKISAYHGVAFRVCEKRYGPESAFARIGNLIRKGSFVKTVLAKSREQPDDGGSGNVTSSTAPPQPVALVSTAASAASAWPKGQEETFLGFSSCNAGGISEQQAKALGGPTQATILCIKTKSGRALAGLSFTPDTPEVVLLPGFVGRVVGCIDVGFKKVLSTLWEFDVVPYDVVELVENGLTDVSGFIVNDLTEDLLVRLNEEIEDVTLMRHLSLLYNVTKDVEKEKRFLNSVMRLVPGDYEANLAMAVLLDKRLRDYNNCWKYYDAALLARPDDADTHCLLGQLWEVRFKDPKKGKRHYELALRSVPGHANAHAHLGFVIEEYKGDLTHARNNYVNALKSNPTCAKANYLLGRMAWREDKDIDRAKELLEAALFSENSIADAHYWLGVVLEDPRLGEHVNARFQYELALHLDQAHAAAHSHLGCILYHRFKEHTTALEHLVLAVQMDPDDEPAHLTMAAIYEKQLHDVKSALRHYECALTVNHENPDTHCAFARLMEIFFDDPKRAKKHYELAIKLVPQHAEAHAALGYIIERFAHEYDLAKRHYDIALKSEPTHAKANLRAGVYSRLIPKNYELARAHLEQAVKTDPNDAEAHFALATLLNLNFQEYSEARFHYETSLQIDDGVAECHNEYGHLLMTQFQEFDNAKRHFIYAIRIFPDFAEAHNNYGIAIKDVAKGDADELRKARECFERTLQIDRKHQNAHSNMGLILTMPAFGDHKLARKHNEMALKLLPQDHVTRTTYGLLLEMQFQDYRAAVHQYELAIKANSFYGLTHSYLARCLMLHIPCDLTRPQAEFEIALTMIPQDAETHNNYAFLLDRKLNKYEEARSHYDAAIKINPNYDVAHHNVAFLLTKHLNDHGKARRHLTAAIRINPDCIEYHKDMAQLLIQRFEDFRSATKFLKNILQIDPYDHQAHLTYGNILENYYNEFDKAKLHYTTALELYPDDANAHIVMAMLLRKRYKDTDGAVEHFQAALQIDPMNDCALTSLNRMRTTAPTCEFNSPGANRAALAAAESPSFSRLPSILQRQSSIDNNTYADTDTDDVQHQQQRQNANRSGTAYTDEDSAAGGNRSMEDDIRSPDKLPSIERKSSFSF